LSTHEFEGLTTLASSLGLTTAARFNNSAKPRELVQLLACKQEICGRSLWNANGLFTKSYKCIEEAARAFRALCMKLVAALGMALLSLAGAASEPRRDAAAALLQAQPSSAAAGGAFGGKAFASGDIGRARRAIL
jgi:hypothetical protein